MSEYVRLSEHELEKFTRSLEEDDAVDVETVAQVDSALHSYLRWAEENGETLTPAQSGASTPDRETYREILDVTRRLDGEHGAPVGLVIEHVLDGGLGVSDVLLRIQDLLIAGEMYEPISGHVRAVDDDGGPGEWVERYTDGDRDG